MIDRPKTKGEFRVGISFNPSNNPMVDQIKAKAAELIDLVESIPAVTHDRTATEHDELTVERMRLKALAQTHIEDAAMWAVKAAMWAVKAATKAA